MYLSILILPLLSSIVSGLLGRRVGVTGSHIVSISCLVLASILATLAFYEVGLCQSAVVLHLGPWIDSENMSILWEFLFDSLTVSMFIPVLYISTLIHLFSCQYMSEDPHQQRFFSYLSLFTFFMLVLVSGANYFVLFVGWEGIGVASYLLINFWWTRLQANKAAILAFTMNRLGDMTLSIGFFSIFALFGSLDYATLFNLCPSMNETSLTIIALLVLGGAMAKSAQIPLHSWLPGSMEGPTPVSALIHAATLVTAGLYLLIRSSPILEYSPTALLLITLLGSTTAFVAALCGLVQNDIKRIIAFSTISQLGYMVLALGLSKYDVSLFHVINHAFFKALLFLSAGSVIHSMADEQDLRRLGGLIKFLPFTYTIMLIGTLSLLATPWLTGFYSKDLIIELAFAQYSFSGYFAFVLASLTAGLTAFYSMRLISLTFLTYPNAQRQTYLNTHEASATVLLALSILAIFSIFFGYVCSDLFVGMASDFLSNSIFIRPNNITLVEAEFSLDWYVKLLPLILTIIGAFLGIFLYHKAGAAEILVDLFLSSKIRNIGLENIINLNKQTKLTDWALSRKIYTFLNSKFLFDILYNKYFISNTLSLSYGITKYLDKGLIETMGPYGLSHGAYALSRQLSFLDTGIITTYALYIALGILSLIFVAFSTHTMIAQDGIISERIFLIYLITLILIFMSSSKTNNNTYKLK